MNYLTFSYKKDEETSENQSSAGKRQKVSTEKGLPENKCQNLEHRLMGLGRQDCGQMG